MRVEQDPQKDFSCDRRWRRGNQARRRFLGFGVLASVGTSCEAAGGVCCEGACEDATKIPKKSSESAAAAARLWSPGTRGASSGPAGSSLFGSFVSSFLALGLGVALGFLIFSGGGKATMSETTGSSVTVGVGMGSGVGSGVGSGGEVKVAGGSGSEARDFLLSGFAGFFWGAGEAVAGAVVNSGATTGGVITGGARVTAGTTLGAFGWAFGWAFGGRAAAGGGGIILAGSVTTGKARGRGVAIALARTGINKGGDTTGTGTGTGVCRGFFGGAVMKLGFIRVAWESFGLGAGLAA